MVHHSGRLHPPAVLIFSREFVSNLTAKEGWGRGVGGVCGRGLINFLSFAFLLLNNVLIALSIALL